jgi:hypothetical protein
VCVCVCGREQVGSAGQPAGNTENTTGRSAPGWPGRGPDHRKRVCVPVRCVPFTNRNIQWSRSHCHRNLERGRRFKFEGVAHSVEGRVWSWRWSSPDGVGHFLSWRRSPLLKGGGWWWEIDHRSKSKWQCSHLTAACLTHPLTHPLAHARTYPPTHSRATLSTDSHDGRRDGAVQGRNRASRQCGQRMWNRGQGNLLPNLLPLSPGADCP